MITQPDKRKPAVAGRFYPSDKLELRRVLQQLLIEARCRESAPPKALIAPHAGYIFSGSTAAQAYKQLQETTDSISTVVLLGPAHRVYLQGIALPSQRVFNTPLGDIPLDDHALERVAKFPQVIVSDEAHRQEHSLEVQLPFLQEVLGAFTLVPLVVGHCPPGCVGAVIDALWGGPETLFVISSDLSHFENYDSARKHDLDSCQRILAGDATLAGTDACGAAPINGFLSSDHGATLKRSLLGYCNSGDTAGDKQRVVGYASFSLH